VVVDRADLSAAICAGVALTAVTMIQRRRGGNGSRSSELMDILHRRDRAAVVRIEADRGAAQLAELSSSVIVASRASGGLDVSAKQPRG
jgi:hypothetical protein